jgi:ABC-type branched-subunit amino acid transport system substrate-binding protein
MRRQARAGRIGILGVSLVVGFASVVLTVPVASAAPSKFPPIPPGPITLGVSADLSGPAAAYGKTTQEAFENVTLKAFDAAHPNGIDGHKLQIKVFNDQSTATGAVQAANAMVGSKVAGVVTVSPNATSQSQELAVLGKNKVPAVSALLGSQYANTKNYPYAFGVIGSVQQYGDVAGRWIGKTHYKRIAVLTDGLAQDTDSVNQIISGMKPYAPQAKVVASVTVPPGSVDDAAAITKLKAARPDLVIVYLGVGFGPVWQAMQSANWSPAILSYSGAWYDGFTAMGDLASKAYTPFSACANSATQTFTPEQKNLMGQYSAATGGTSVNYLVYVAVDSVAVDLMAYAIDKYHSTDPRAIKQALEGIRNQKFIGLKYSFSPTNHFGLTGQFGATVCNMAPPYAGGIGKVPLSALKS